MIHLDHVTRRYGRKTAVDDLCLLIPPGELFALLGPNGAGKTTTIKLVTGLLRPDAGRIVLDGYDVQREPMAARRCLGYVPDRPYLYPMLSGWEFLEFAAGVRGLRPPQVRTCAAPLLSRLGLEGAAAQLIGTYSHGMRQKLAIVAALLHVPSVLVIDEPMVGLDPRSARTVKDLLREHADSGGTVLLSTHSLDIADELADRVGILHHGRLVVVDTTEGLRYRTGCQAARLEDLFLQMTCDDDVLMIPARVPNTQSAGR